MCSYADKHPNKDTQEGESDLPQLEVMVVCEYDVEGPEEQVQHTEQNRGEDAEVQAHRFEGEEQERPVYRSNDCLRN